MKKLVVLLPQGKLFEQALRDAIVPAVAEANWTMEHLPPEFSTENHLGALCTALESANLVLADLTGANPNIMYQVGYAHGVGRKVLLIAQHVENFPFDRSKHPTIAYAGDRAFLKGELISFLAEGKLRTQEEANQPGLNVAREKFMSIFGDILAAHQYKHSGEIQQENPTTFVLIGQDMELPLVQHLARRARELGLRLKLM